MKLGCIASEPRTEPLYLLNNGYYGDVWQQVINEIRHKPRQSRAQPDPAQQHSAVCAMERTGISNIDDYVLNFEFVITVRVWRAPISTFDDCAKRGQCGNLDIRDPQRTDGGYVSAITGSRLCSRTARTDGD